MDGKKLSIVILSYNTKKLLQQCLESLFAASRHSKRGIEIIIIDNNSTDGSREYLESLRIYEYTNIEYKGEKKNNQLPMTKNQITTSDQRPNNILGSSKLQLKIIFNSQNLGFAGGNNVGIREALANGAEYVMLLNSDTLVKDAFWEPMIEVMEKDPLVGVVGPKIYFAPGWEFHKNRYSAKDRGKVIWYAGGYFDWRNVQVVHRGVDEVDQGQYDKVEPVEFISGCCLLSKRSVWQTAGLLDERYFLYFEDADFCLRARKAGWRLFYCPQARLWHLNAGSSSCGGPLQDYFITRNRLLFGMRWAPFKAKFALLRESFRLLRSGRRWQKIGVLDFYRQRWGKGSWK